MYLEQFLCTRDNENHTWLMKISEISQIRHVIKTAKLYIFKTMKCYYLL